MRRLWIGGIFMKMSDATKLERVAIRTNMKLLHTLNHQAFNLNNKLYNSFGAVLTCRFFFLPWFMFIASLSSHEHFYFSFLHMSKVFFCMSVHRKIVGLGPNPKWNCRNSNIIFQMLKRQFCGLPKRNQINNHMNAYHYDRQMCLFLPFSLFNFNF